MQFVGDGLSDVGQSPPWWAAGEGKISNCDWKILTWPDELILLKDNDNHHHYYEIYYKKVTGCEDFPGPWSTVWSTE